jgi:hypothetical protein
MSRKPVLHEEDYETGDAPIRLTVVVGERQIGTSVVFIDDKAIANGDIEGLRLGEGKSLRGETLTVYTLVTDIRDNSDEMAVTWILDGGDHRTSATETGTVSKHFGSQMFKGVFRLK